MIVATRPVTCTAALLGSVLRLMVASGRTFAALNARRSSVRETPVLSSSACVHEAARQIRKVAARRDAPAAAAAPSAEDECEVRQRPMCDHENLFGPRMLGCPISDLQFDVARTVARRGLGLPSIARGADALKPLQLIALYKMRTRCLSSPPRQPVRLSRALHLIPWQCIVQDAHALVLVAAAPAAPAEPASQPVPRCAFCQQMCGQQGPERGTELPEQGRANVSQNPSSHDSQSQDEREELST
jgi:hypothetical protein